MSKLRKQEEEMINKDDVFNTIKNLLATIPNIISIIPVLGNL